MYRGGEMYWYHTDALGSIYHKRNRARQERDAEHPLSPPRVKDSTGRLAGLGVEV
jgi:hypothetical protein